MIFLIFTFIILLVILSLFIFPKLSPVPYFPTNKIDLPLIIKALFNRINLPSTFHYPPTKIMDLGAGDGLVIFAAAQEAYLKKLKTQFIAVEINPILILILHLRRLFHPNKKNIKIIWADMFKIDLKTLKVTNFITIYLYISPWLVEKALKNIKTQISNFQVISYMYKILGWENNLVKILKGKNKVFIYTSTVLHKQVMGVI
jgi:hypothetical protein